MGIEDQQARQDNTEAEFCGRFEAHLRRLEQQGRCVWRPQVRMLIWRHACDDRRTSVRIDYVASFDDGPLVGIEAKRAPRRPAVIGHALRQCADYAGGIIGGHVDVPRQWVGQPLKAVFLAVEIGSCHDHIRKHYSTAPRLFGAFNVGFIKNKKGGIELTLNDDFRWWNEECGYRADAMAKSSRVGSSTFRPATNRSAAEPEAQIIASGPDYPDVDWWIRK